MCVWGMRCIFWIIFHIVSIYVNYKFIPITYFIFAPFVPRNLGLNWSYNSVIFSLLFNHFRLMSVKYPPTQETDDMCTRSPPPMNVWRIDRYIQFNRYRRRIGKYIILAATIFEFQRWSTNDLLLLPCERGIYSLKSQH